MVNDQFTAQAGDRADIQNVCVVVTDGFSNLDVDLLEGYSQQAQVR